MNRKEYEAKKALLKRVREVARARVLSARGTLARTRANELYSDAQERLSRFIRGSVAHYLRRVEALAAAHAARPNLFTLLYSEIPDDDAPPGPPRRDRPPSRDRSGEAADP